MKVSILKLMVSFLVLVMVLNVASAQTRKRNARKRSTGGATTDYFGNPVNSGNTPAPGNNTPATPANNRAANNASTSDDYFSASPRAATGTADTTRRNRGGNIPLEVVPSNGNALTDIGKPSLRSEDAIERNLVKDRTPLAYDHIREDDAVYRQRVWRNIDVREKMNLTFKNPAIDDDGSQMFISILYRAITNSDSLSRVTAFKDERFTEPYSLEDFTRKFSGGVDTTDVLDLEGNVVKKQVRQREFMVDSIYQFQLKEEWIFDKETSRMFVRIIGIAPMMKTYLSDGTPVSEEPSPLFWVYYPDLRPSLAKAEVINTKNFGGKMSWEELFESRFFSSYITKSTLDNSFDQSLKQYIKDPLFRLLEGENIKEKIFNYEQDLWSY